MEPKEKPPLRLAALELAKELGKAAFNAAAHSLLTVSSRDRGIPSFNTNNANQKINGPQKTLENEKT